jgi:hypothetical protein
MAFVHPYGIIGFASHIEFTGSLIFCQDVDRTKIFKSRAKYQYLERYIKLTDGKNYLANL